jgi:hypothetical protein
MGICLISASSAVKFFYCTASTQASKACTSRIPGSYVSTTTTGTVGPLAAADASAADGAASTTELLVGPPSRHENEEEDDDVMPLLVRICLGSRAESEDGQRWGNHEGD